MADYRALAIKLLTADGKVTPRQIKMLKKFLFADDKVPEEDLEFLGSLRTHLIESKGKVNPKFEEFYLKCLQAACMKDGAIGLPEVDWIARHLVSDKTIKPTAKKKFLDQLKQRAGATPPEFDGLYAGLTKKSKPKKKQQPAQQ